MLRVWSFAKCWLLSISGTIWHGDDETRKLDQANDDRVMHKRAGLTREASVVPTPIRMCMSQIHHTQFHPDRFSCGRRMKLTPEIN
jgi:hypothetical protein